MQRGSGDGKRWQEWKKEMGGRQEDKGKVMEKNIEKV